MRGSMPQVRPGGAGLAAARFGLGDAHLEVLTSAAAQHADRDGVANRAVREHPEELAGVLDRLAIEADDHIPGTHAGLVRAPRSRHPRDHGAAVRGNAELL